MNDKQASEFERTSECNFCDQPGRHWRFRCSAFIQQNQVGIVIRTINTTIPRFEELMLPPILRDIIMAKTRSGDLRRRHRQRQNHLDGGDARSPQPQSAATSSPIESIEFVHEHRNCIVTQREIGTDTDNWGVALKNTLRQAPDVILIGEIRERETMDTPSPSAETGHLCLATLRQQHQPGARPHHQLLPGRAAAATADGLSLNLRSFVSQRLIARRDGQRAACRRPKSCSTHR